MFGAFILAASFATFGPIGEDFSFLYVAEDGGIVRIDKSDLSRHALIVSTERRIAAIDVDGDRVLYATAPDPQCGRKYFGAYSFPDCTWVDAEPTHELRSAPATGGVEFALASHSRGIAEIAHDDDWVYWIEPANVDARDGRLWRRRKADGFLQLLAENLDVSRENQHPFVLQEDSIWVVSGARLLRVFKAGGIATVIASVFPQSSIAADGHVVYFANGSGSLFQVDSRTSNLSVVRYPNEVRGALSIFGVADGHLVAMNELAGTGGTLRTWYSVDLCARTWRELGRISVSKYEGYFEPLADPAMAIDLNGVYIYHFNVLSMAFTGPSACSGSGNSRRRTSSH